MDRYMAELGLTPASRSRIAVNHTVAASEPLQVQVVRFIVDPKEKEPLALDDRSAETRTDEEPLAIGDRTSGTFGGGQALGPGGTKPIPLETSRFYPLLPMSKGREDLEWLSR